MPEATATPSDAEPAEISWRELDSLDELEGLGVETAPVPERGFDFEEADAATLAELGLSGQPEAGEVRGTQAATIADAEADATAAPAGAPKKRGRKPSSRAASEAASESASKSTSKAAAKPRARSAAKAGAKATTSSRGTGSAAKPRAARTSRSKSAAPAAESDQGSDEGIWKRFTSGRGSRKRTTPEPPEAA
jgi:hypothetical protein